MKEEIVFVSFDKTAEGYIASINLKDFLLKNDDFDSLLKKASSAYEDSILNMKTKLTEIEYFRHNRIKLPARKIWELGDIIFKFIDDLKKLEVEIDGIYNHLERDLGVKRKWLEKVIILRRYIPKIEMIPVDLNWGSCEKGTRRIAEQISGGTIPHRA
ncbi:MAG: hypothetical protein WC958_00765 [Dehalococcoidales bacterium]